MTSHATLAVVDGKDPESPDVTLVINDQEIVVAKAHAATFAERLAAICEGAEFNITAGPDMELVSFMNMQDGKLQGVGSVVQIRVNNHRFVIPSENFRETTGGFLAFACHLYGYEYVVGTLTFMMEEDAKQ